MQIPAAALRGDALNALRKRSNIDGAALFGSIARRRDRDLLRLLIAFEILADFLDCASETGAGVGTRNGAQLHRALVDALDPHLGQSCYYRWHTSQEDGGYARTLVRECRIRCTRLPRYDTVKPRALEAARLAASVLALNHEPDTVLRDRLLLQWASVKMPGETTLTWFERSGGASAWLTVLALLALAADRDVARRDVDATYAAYMPWVSLVGTMLDSYSDIAQDTGAAQHSYIAHYQDTERAVKRVSELLRSATGRARRLPHAERHAVVLACMAAMYLTKGSAVEPQRRSDTTALARAAGPLTQVLVPVLRLWHILYGRGEQETQMPAAGQQRSKRRSRAQRGDALPLGSRLPAALQTYLFWRDPHAYLSACRRRNGTTFTIRPVKSPPLVFVSAPEEIRSLLSAPANVLHPGEGGAVIAPLIGQQSFMTSDEHHHIRVRRAIAPAFRLRAMLKDAPTVEAAADRHIKSWPLGESFAAHPRLRALSLEVILRTLFGVDADLDELHRTLINMFAITAGLTLQEPPLRHLPGWHGAWRRFLGHRAGARQILGELVEDARRGQRAGLPLTLLRSRNTDGSRMSVSQVQDNLMSLILAGHETTASELAWALQLLAHNPQVQATLTDAIDRGDERYLAATVQEVLRHRPVFLFTIPRVVREPVRIGSRTYCPPVHLLGCIHLLHHDPDIYPEPNRFLPERFIDRPPPAGHWLPWGGGRKRCPGRHLAAMEMQIVLRALLADMTVLPATPRPERARWRSVIVTPGKGCRIVLRRRNGRDAQ